MSTWLALLGGRTPQRRGATVPPAKAVVKPKHVQGAIPAWPGATS